MEPENDETQIDHQRLDHFALRYLAVELGYGLFIVLMLLLVVVISILSPSVTNFIDLYEIVPWTVMLPYGLAFLGNMIIGLWGLITYIQENREGYPGTGHLVNWIYVFSLLVIFMIFISAVIPEFF